MRVAALMAKQHRHGRSWAAVSSELYSAFGPARPGLSQGIVVAPRPNRRGGETRMPAVKDVGELGAGEPHARFDGRSWKRSQYGSRTRRPSGNRGT